MITMAAAPVLSPADLATELGTDPRTARKFLRSITPKEDQPGKGSRWAIKGTKTELTRLKKKFTEFEAQQAEAKAKRDEQAESEGLDPETFDPSVEDDAAITNMGIDSLEGPTDEDLAALED